MSYTHPLQKEFVNIAFAQEAVFKTAIPIASVSGWIGILQEDQDLPFAESDLRPLHTSGHTDADAALASTEAAGPKPITVVEGKRTYRGRLSWLVQNRQMFEEIFGFKTTTLDSPSGGFNTHTFLTGVISARPRKSFTLAAWTDKNGGGFTADDDISISFVGVKFTSITFNFAEGEELTIEADVAGTTHTDQAAFPGAFAELITKPFLMQQGALTVFGGAYARIKTGSITLNHNTEEKWYDGVDPFDLIDKRIAMEASLTLVIDNDDIWDLLVAKPRASTRLSVTFTRTASEDTLTFESEASGTTTEAFPNFDIKFGGGEGEVEVEVPFILKNLRAVIVDNEDLNHVWKDVSA